MSGNNIGGSTFGLIVSNRYRGEKDELAARAIFQVFRHFPPSTELANMSTVDHSSVKRVLIYDEKGFSRICSALLEISGCSAHVIEESADELDRPGVGLFVTSYPYGAFMLDEVQKRSIPAIVMFDNLDERFVGMMHSYDNMCFMIKPVDYNKFRQIVRQFLSGGMLPRKDSVIL